MRKLLILSIFLMPLVATAQKTDTVFLSGLLKSRPDLFGKVLQHPTQNEIQILYTQIDRDKNNVPHFKTFSYRADPTWYFYPASTVKLAASIFALEKLNALKVPGLTKKTTMITDSSYAGQTKVLQDTSAENGLPSIEHYIKKILLVSDNDAFNRLFEFVGREEMNSKLQKNGLVHSRILNRLAIGDGGEPAKHTNPISFYNGDKLVYRQEAAYDAKDYPLELKNLIRGTGYMDANDKLVNEPYSFANKNVFTIEDQQALMKKLMFPEAFPKAERFNLTPDDYQLIYKYMSMYPTESTYPNYDPKEFWTVYSKFLFYGHDKNAQPDPNIRIFNKYGDSYGYVIDNSYFVDFNSKVEFMLTAVVQSNEDGIYNDGNYEYETVCYPFLKNLGQIIYEHELQRKKQNLPKLEKLKFKY
ncbi:MAG TPA: serine hydrolase [Daejeonella sp.]|nr:serine hydrolase [Daejeonella sp.]